MAASVKYTKLDEAVLGNLYSRIARQSFFILIEPVAKKPGWKLTNLFTGLDAHRIYTYPGDQVIWYYTGPEASPKVEVEFARKTDKLRRFRAPGCPTTPFKGWTARDKRAKVRIPTGPLNSPEAVLEIDPAAAPNRGGWALYKYSIWVNGKMILDPDVGVGGPGNELPSP